MRKLSFLLLAVALLPLSALAQDKAEVFGGYSLFRLDANAAPGDRNLNGWDAEIGGKLAPFLSIVGDVNGVYHTQNVLGADIKTSVYTFMAGPRVGVTLGNIRPFAHILFGLARSKADFNSIGAGTTTDNNFATAIGGGVDIGVAPFISIRPVKLDYVLVKTNPNDVFDSNGNGLSHTNNLRYSAGIVLHF
jgi:Outer membrane protein beta-barrel domain